MAKIQGTRAGTSEAEQTTCHTVKLPTFLKCFLSNFLYAAAQTH